MKVINLSLGGYVHYLSDKYNLTRDAVNYAYTTKGKAVVFTAGNEGNIISYYVDNSLTP